MGQSTELWKPVVGFEGLYEVSDLGRVLSLPRTVVKSNGVPYTAAGGIRSLSLNHKGYPKVTLVSDSVLTTRVVHRLVLESFVGPKPDGMECRHLNGIRTDVRLSNLAWGTPTENAGDKFDHWTAPNMNRWACIRGHSLSGANLFINIRGSRVCRACKREFKSSYDHKRPFSKAMADLQYERIMSS